MTIMTTTKNRDCRPSKLNLSREIQGQIKVCNMPLHTVKHELLTGHAGIIICFDLKYILQNQKQTYNLQEFSSKIALHKILSFEKYILLCMNSCKCFVKPEEFSFIPIIFLSIPDHYM